MKYMVNSLEDDVRGRIFSNLNPEGFLLQSLIESLDSFHKVFESVKLATDRVKHHWTEIVKVPASLGFDKLERLPIIGN